MVCLLFFMEHSISISDNHELGSGINCCTDIPTATISFLLCFNYENNQQDALYRLLYYSKSAVHVSGDVFVHNQEHLTVFTVSGSVHPSCCRPQPAAAWVNTSRYCKYSQVLLVMGENIARNM